MCGRVLESRGGVLAKHLLKVNPTTLSEAFLERELLQNMTNKNTYCFATFAAVASLGLGLMISGCGDSGSTDAAQLGKTGQVIFKYDVLAKAAASPKYETKIKNEIVTVKYAFYGVKDGVRFIESYKDNSSYTYEFKHEAEDKDEDVVINNVNDKAAGVIAAYYDKDGNIVAVGHDDFELGTADKKATIEKPDYAELADASYSVTAKPYILSPEETTEISVVATIGKKDYHLLPFVTLEGIDKYTDVLAYGYSHAAGDVYKGVGYKGEHKGIVTAGDIKVKVNGKDVAQLDKNIYVTDQVPNAVTIEAGQVEGKGVTTVAATEDTPEALTLVFAGENSILAAKKAVDLTAEGKDPLYYAVNEQPITAFITGYSADPEKGPTPKDVKSEITDTTKVTLTSTVAESAKAEGLNIKAVAEGNTTVSATYKVDDTTTVNSNKLDVKVVVPGAENFAFTTTNDDKDVVFMKDVTVDTEKDQTFTMAVAGKATLDVDGTSYVSTPIEYTETAPAIKPLAETVKDITYTKTDKKNEYTLEVKKTAAPDEDVEIGVDLSNFDAISVKK